MVDRTIVGASYQALDRCNRELMQTKQRGIRRTPAAFSSFGCVPHVSAHNKIAGKRGEPCSQARAPEITGGGGAARQRRFMESVLLYVCCRNLLACRMHRPTLSPPSALTRGSFLPLQERCARVGERGEVLVVTRVYSREVHGARRWMKGCTSYGWQLAGVEVGQGVGVDTGGARRAGSQPLGEDSGPEAALSHARSLTEESYQLSSISELGAHDEINDVVPSPASQIAFCARVVGRALSVTICFIFFGSVRASGNGAYNAERIAPR